VQFRLRTLAALVLVLTLVPATVASAARGVPRVGHVVLIVFENHERTSVLGHGDAPTFERLATTYAQATDYHAVTHPSLPNYLALVSGSTHGVTSDCTDCPQHGPTIGSELTAARRTWGAYAEGFPNSPRFAMKHVPFLYFQRDVGHVHPLPAFHPSKLPAFALVVPDLCNDMHDCSVATGDRWLARFIPPLLTEPSTVVFVAFDEGTTSEDGGGLVPMIAAGTAVRPHSVTRAPANHYVLLRTMEALLGLPPIGQAAAATPLTGIWR
jgi:acid phosphatase